MPFETQLAALVDALTEDLEALSPYAMATMAEYGKVGGYAQDYVELKRDVLELARLCLGLFPDARLDAVDDMPPLATGRMIDEAFLIHERDRLLAAMRRLEAEMRRPSARPPGLDPAVGRGLDRLLARSGIETEIEPPPPAPAPSRASTPPARTAQPTVGDRIYVSSRFAPSLGAQLGGFVRRFGFEPLGAPASARAESIDMDRVERLIGSCVGGVISLIQDFGRAPDAGVSPERALRAGLAEISLAERRLDSNLMVVARMDMIERLPARLLTRQVFMVKRGVMDDYELALFGALAEKTPWLRR